MLSPDKSTNQIVMDMLKNTAHKALLLLIFLGSSNLYAAESNVKTPKTKSKPLASIEQRAKNTVRQSFKAYVSENTQALLALYHPESSLRGETKEAVQTYFDDNQLIGELVETTYLSHDKDYVYLTAKVITRDVGPSIRLSKYERDILFILKPFGTRYLIWVFRTLDNPVLNETTF